VECPRSSALPRLVGLGSSRPSTVPRTLTPMPTPLPRPPSEPEVLGLVGAAPSTLLAGPQTRRPPLRDLLRPPSLLAPPPPQWVMRPPSMPRRSTPQWAPKRGAHRGGPPDKSCRRTATRHHRRHCHHHSPLRPSRRETPRAGTRRGSVDVDASSAPPAPGPCGLDASWRRISPLSSRLPRGVEPPERPDLPEVAVMFP
jgi:hypothetical protein